jgi:hypothetical protein
MFSFNLNPAHLLHLDAGLPSDSITMGGVQSPGKNQALPEDEPSLEYVDEQRSTGKRLLNLFRYDTSF